MTPERGTNACSIAPRVSAEFGYQRRWLVNFLVTDNQNQTPADYTSFSVIIPTDSRLPGGGGGTLPGIYNVTPEASARRLLEAAR